MLRLFRLSRFADQDLVWRDRGALEMSQGHVLRHWQAWGLQSLHGLKLALHFGRTLTDIHGLAHCNERGRARADAGRADNGDNLRWRHVDCGAMWPSERHENIH